MSAAKSRHLALAYAAWADDRRLAEGEHDAVYTGMLSGVRVHVDTGVRDTGAYAVVVRIAIACGPNDVLVKRGGDAKSADDRVVAAARALVDERRMIRSVRLEQDAVEIRLDPGSGGEVIEEAVRRIADAWRSPGRAQAPFR